MEPKVELFTNQNLDPCVAQSQLKNLRLSSILVIAKQTNYDYQIKSSFILMNASLNVNYSNYV